MIVVLGRPVAASFPAGEGAGRTRPTGLAVEIAAAAVAAEGRVELVGAVGDDAAGDAIVVGLGVAGIGHAALLRDPATPTPLQGERARRLPRLERADVELGLGYHLDWSVLVLAETFPADAEDAALEAAAFRGAQVIAVVPAGSVAGERLSRVATVIEAPRDPAGAFARTVGRFAAELDRGTAPAEALSVAARAVGWEARA